MRQMIGFALLAAVASGCSSGGKESGSASPTKSASQAVASAPDTAKVVPGTIRIFIKGVYLGCEPSQLAARRVLTQVPDLTDLIIDPALRTIFCRVPLTNYEKARKAKGTQPVAYTPLSALANVGLGGEIETPDDIEDKLLIESGAGMLIRDQPSEKDVVIYGVFAGSDMARKAIQDAVAPYQVTFISGGELRDVRISGMNVDEIKLIDQLKAAGFYGTLEPRK